MQSLNYSSIRKLNIFLTGVTGFIGRNIFEQLGKKYNFYAPTHKKLDLTDTKKVESFFKTHNIDVVIHTATSGGKRTDVDSYEIAELNLRMFFNIARCEKYFKKMIFLGSGAEYDNTRSLIRVSEKDFDKVVPKSQFFFNKYVCSKYIEKSDKIVNLRLFGIFGKYEDYSIRFISNAICRNILGKPITINQNVYFDYLYIDDFVGILEYFIENSVHYRFYNVGTGKKIDLYTIAKIVNEKADKKSKITIKKKGLNNEYTCNNSRLKKEIKDIKFTDFKLSVDLLYTWYKKIKNELDVNLVFKD